MLKSEALKEIHESFAYGFNQDAVELIDGHFTMYDFWGDYKDYLDARYTDNFDAKNHHFTRAVITYHRLKNR